MTIAERIAAPQEWDEIVKRIRRRHPLIADTVERGTCRYIENGVTIVGPAGAGRFRTRSVGNDARQSVSGAPPGQPATAAAPAAARAPAPVPGDPEELGVMLESVDAADYVAFGLDEAPTAHPTRPTTRATPDNSLGELLLDAIDAVQQPTETREHDLAEMLNEGIER